MLRNYKRKITCSATVFWAINILFRSNKKKISSLVRAGQALTKKVCYH